MNNKKFSLIFFLIFASFFSRAIVVYFFGDTILDYEWGVIISNMEKSHIFGYRIVDGVVVPNIFMPPLYPFFLYGFLIAQIPIMVTNSLYLVISLILIGMKCNYDKKSIVKKLSIR